MKKLLILLLLFSACKKDNYLKVFSRGQIVYEREVDLPNVRNPFRVDGLNAQYTTEYINFYDITSDNGVHIISDASNLSNTNKPYHWTGKAEYEPFNVIAPNYTFKNLETGEIITWEELP